MTQFGPGIVIPGSSFGVERPDLPSAILATIGQDINCFNLEE
jgi:hypothetical protein